MQEMPTEETVETFDFEKDDYDPDYRKVFCNRDA